VYNFKEGEVLIQKGSGQVQYTPSVNTRSSSVAYEYVFNNPMAEDMAINLKQIDATGVTLSYAYSDTPLTSVTSSKDMYEVQRIAQNQTKYIYIVVTGDNTTNFSSKITWYQGIAENLTITSNTCTLIQTIVKGQPTIAQPADPVLPTEPELDGYYFDTWYLDAEYTQIASFPIDSNQTLHARFANLPSSWFTPSGDTYYVSKGSGNLPTNLVIPAMYNGKVVTHIDNPSSRDNGVFKGNTTLRSISLPCTIEEVGNGAFYQCYNVSTVDLISCVNLERMGVSAFHDVKPTSINFKNCSKLKEIGDMCFAGVLITTLDLTSCTSLEKIGHTSFYIVPATTINLKNLTNLQSIGENAFVRCTSITSIDLSGCSNLTTLGYSIFESCYNLKTVNLSNCSKLTTIGSSAFKSCSSLTTVNLNGCAGLKTISYSAFSGTALTSMDFKDCINLETIDYGAFLWCSQLKTVNLTNCTKLKTIGYEAFAGKAGEIYMTLQNLDLSKCTSLTTIGDNAFFNCDAFTSMTIPKNVSSIGTSVFSECDILETIIVDSQNTTYDSRNGCNAIIRKSDNTLIQGCKGTVIPNTVTTIGSRAFFGHSNFSTMPIPEGVTKIEGSALEWCTSLSNVTIPSTVIEIGSYAFANNSKLSDVTFIIADYYWKAGTTRVDVGNRILGKNASWFDSTYASSVWTRAEKVHVAKIGSRYYSRVETALRLAASGDVVVVPPLTLEVVEPRCISSSTVKNGVTLLIAYDANGTRVSSNATHSETGYTTYKGTLTNKVELSGTLTVEAGGTLEVAGELTSGFTSNSYVGHTGGRYAELKLRAYLSRIEVAKNATLKCTGFISDTNSNTKGNININGSLYMPFVIKDFRGGYYMLAAYNNNITPFNQYILPNISTKYTVNMGASVIAWCNLLINNIVQTFEVKFIGSTSDYLFQTLSGTTAIVQTTDEKTNVVFDGGMSLNKLTMSLSISILQNLKVDSSTFHFPLTWAFDLTLKNGTYDFTKQDIKLLPGAKLTVASDAIVNAKNIAVYTELNETIDVHAHKKYPTDVGSAILNVEGELHCSTLAGPAYSSTIGAIIDISSTSSSDFITYETTGDINKGLLNTTIETKPITHTTKLYWRVYTTDYVTVYYVTVQADNTSQTYTKTANGWTKS
ncbi:MAG: leucine-rich repeat protein, partial [Clostridia bacterium]